MDHPERPSRHRSRDKWKRIIELAGDSDSSEWSSDSDAGMGANSLHYRHLDSTLGGGSSSNGNRDQQSPVNAVLSSSSTQNKPAQDPLLGFSFEQSLGVKPSTSGQTVAAGWAADFRALTARLKSIGSDAGAGTSNSFTHLMHHDYAEREVNNERGTNEFPFSHSPSRDSQVPWKRKRKWMLCNRSEVPSIDCSNAVNTPSTSSSGLGSDEAPVPEPESAINIIETPAEEDRWRILSSNRNIMNSPTRRRFFDPAGEPTDVGEIGIPVPGCSTSVVLATSIQTQTQSLAQPQVGPTDFSSTEPGTQPVSPCPFFTPSDWYVQKKVMSRNKQVRFRDQPYLHESGEGSSVPEDYSHPVRRPEPEIQVLSMAGPSNGSSRIVYPNGSRHSRPLPEEAPLPEETQANPPAVPRVSEAEDEGVEVIMVDDAQSENTGENKSVQATAGSAQDHQEQQQQSSAEQQQTKEEDVGPTSVKQMRLDDELLNQGLIGLLECPVCMEYMGPPIHQCRRGHLVCSICKPKLPSCPTCRSRFTESRNLAMEKVADKLHYPCKNAHVGCTTTLRLRDKDEHEANCIFRSYRCIVVPPCEWKGQHNDILPHVRQMHANTLLQGPEHVLEMRLGDFTEQSSQNWIVSALGELFRVNLGAVRAGRVQVFGCVLLLGPARRAPLFRYVLTVGPAEGDKAQRQMTYSRTTHSYVERCSVYYSAGDSFHLRTESAQLFSSGPPNDRIMCVKLRIEKTES